MPPRAIAAPAWRRPPALSTRASGGASLRRRLLEVAQRRRRALHLDGHALGVVAAPSRPGPVPAPAGRRRAGSPRPAPRRARGWRGVRRSRLSCQHRAWANQGELQPRHLRLEFGHALLQRRHLAQPLLPRGLRAALDPGQPVVHAGAAGGRDLQDLDRRVDAPRIGSRQRSTSKLRCGSRSTLFSSISDAAWNMSGYLSGLSSPSVTDSTTTLCASPRSKPAGHTRLPTFSIISTESSAGASRCSAVCDHGGVEVAALAGVDLQRRRAGGADALGIDAGLLVAFDHRHRQPAAQQLDGAHQQRGLARAGAGHQIEREDAALRQRAAVALRDAVVLGQDVALDLHQARLRHARHRVARRAAAEVQRVGAVRRRGPVRPMGSEVVLGMGRAIGVGVQMLVGVIVRMAVQRAVGMACARALVLAVVRMAVPVGCVIVRMAVRAAVGVGMGDARGRRLRRGRRRCRSRRSCTWRAPCGRLAGRQDGRFRAEHCHSISMSITRMRSPPVTCSWWLPQLRAAVAALRDPHRLRAAHAPGAALGFGDVQPRVGGQRAAHAPRRRQSAWRRPPPATACRSPAAPRPRGVRRWHARCPRRSRARSRRATFHASSISTLQATHGSSESTSRRARCRSASRSWAGRSRSATGNAPSGWKFHSVGATMR